MTEPLPAANAQMMLDDKSFETIESSDPIRALTRQEANIVRRANPGLSLWEVVAWQAAVGVLVAALCWVVVGVVSVAWSAGYGALSVVLPAALFARGLSRQKTLEQGNAAVAGFFIWEMVKVALTVAMLMLAPRLINDLNWLALLAGFVVTMKVYWVAMWLRLKPSSAV